MPARTPDAVEWVRQYASWALWDETQPPLSLLSLEVASATAAPHRCVFLRAVVLQVLCTLPSDDQHHIRDLWRLHGLDATTAPRPTMKDLMREQACTRMTLWRRHKRACTALYAALLAWHAAHPEEAGRAVG